MTTTIPFLNTTIERPWHSFLDEVLLNAALLTLVALSLIAAVS